MVTPERNLPPDAQAWGRDLEKRLAALERAAGIADTNLKATRARFTGVASQAAATEQIIEAVQQEVGEVAEEAHRNDRSNWEPKPPENPRHNQRWFDTTDGNLMRVWIDHGEYPRINYALNPNFSEGTENWTLSGGDLVWQEGFDPHADLVATADGATFVLEEVQGRTVSLELEGTDDDEDGEGGSETSYVGVPWSATAHLTAYSDNDDVTAELEVVDPSDNVLASSGPVVLPVETMTIVQASSVLEEYEIVGAKLRLTITGVDEADYVSLDKVMLEAITEPEDDYFDGDMPGVEWETLQQGRVSVWSGEPDWFVLQDRKAIQEAIDEAKDTLARAFTTAVNAPTPADGADRPDGAYWTQINAAGEQVARWRWVADPGEWVSTPLSVEFIPEAYVDFLAANVAFVEQLLANNVDVAGHLRLAGSLYAQQETYGLELTAEGIDMSSQGLVYLGDPFFIPARPGSLSAIRYNIIVSLPVPGGQNVRDSYLVIYDSRTGEIVREIYADSGHTLGMRHYFDVDNEWIWVGRNTPDPNFGPVDLVAYDLMGNQVATRPVPIALSTFAVSDSYIAVDGGLDGSTPVYDHSGNLLRSIPYNGGARYSPTEYTIHGDVLYDRFGETITLTDIPTGNIVQEIQIPHGDQGSASRSGNEWIHHVDQWATGAWYIVVVDLDTNTISEQMQVDLGGNKTMYGAARGWNDYFVATDQDGTFAIEKRDPFRDEQTQASIDTITGSVQFNNPRLTGVTKTDAIVTDELMASTDSGTLVRARLHGAYGMNWFIDEAERDAMLPHAWEGTEAITRSPVTTVWRMGRNQQWVRVWSEDQADTGWINLTPMPGWNEADATCLSRHGAAWVVVSGRLGSIAPAGWRTLTTVPQSMRPGRDVRDVGYWNTDGGIIGEIRILTNGEVQWYVPAAATSNHLFRANVPYPT